MTKEEKLEEYIWKNFSIDQAQSILQRLSGETPAGEHPRLVGEHAERADQLGATTDQGHGLRVGETKGGVELQRLVVKLTREADALIRENEKKVITPFNVDEAGNRLKAAAELQDMADALSELLAQPQPQSVAGDVEEGLGGPFQNGTNHIERPQTKEGSDDNSPGGDDVSGACLPNAESCDPQGSQR